MCVGNVFERRVPTWTFSPYGLAPIFVAVSKINIQHNMMDEKKDKSYKKNLEYTAQIVHELTQEEVTISGLPYERKEGRFIFEESFPSFLLYPKNKVEVIDTWFSKPNWYDSLEVSAKSGNYIIPKAYLSIPESISLPERLSTPMDSNDKCCIQFYQLMDSRWDERTEYCYRYILPVKSDEWKNSITGTGWYQDCDDIALMNENPFWGKVVRIDFPEERQIHLFPIYNKEGESKFLVIETRFPCTHSAMGKYMYPISLSLGLVTSVAPFDYAIVVASKTPEFDGEIMGGIVKLRPTIKSKRRFFTTDIYSLYEGLKDKVDYDAFRPYCDEKGNLLKDRLNPMQEQEFSALVRMLHENRALARAALMLIDSSMNLECLGAIYAVALETICTGLIEANKEFLPKHLKKNGEERRRKNEEKLTEPFKLPQIGYELSEEKGKELVDIRNSFLHGGVLGYSHTEYHKLLYPCMKLRCFCGLLLFRHAGFKGPILNNAVALGLEEALANKEPLFITYEEKTESPQLTEKPETSV